MRNDVTETTVTPTVNDDGATYELKWRSTRPRGWPWSEPHFWSPFHSNTPWTVDLEVGGNIIITEVTAEDGETTNKYTVTVTRAELLTARMNAPLGHNGQDAFTFELEFSEEVDLSEVTLRDHAFKVTGVR